jgi:hypothetical protein
MKKLYLRSHGYNTARTFEKLREKVLASGGHIVSEYQGMKDDITEVENRTSGIDPVIHVHHITYISFVLDDVYYYYQVDDNPFFPHQYVKAKVHDGEYANSYLDEVSQEWMNDDFFHDGLSEEEIEKAASRLFNQLIELPCSKVVQEWTWKNVPNTYDGQTHRERVMKPVIKRSTHVLA